MAPRSSVILLSGSSSLRGIDRRGQVSAPSGCTPCCGCPDPAGHAGAAADDQGAVDLAAISHKAAKAASSARTRRDGHGETAQARCRPAAAVSSRGARRLARSARGSSSARPGRKADHRTGRQSSPHRQPICRRANAGRTRQTKDEFRHVAFPAEFLPGEEHWSTPAARRCARS